MGTGGGLILAGVLENLQTELENYFGYLNELKMGLQADPVDKPDALGMVELMESMHVPLVAGGVMDQPHIWLLQYNLVVNVRSMFERASRLTQQPQK